MTVSLPRLNSLTGMVEPTTGDPTVRMQSFWNQAMYAIETLQATPGGVSSFNTRVGAVTLAGIDVTTALGYIPTSPASLAAALTPYALQSAVVTSLGGAVGAITLGSGLTMTGQTLSAPGSGGGGGFPLGNIGTIPALSFFTWANQGSATAVQGGGAGTPILFTDPDEGSSANFRFLYDLLPAGSVFTSYIWVRAHAFASSTQLPFIILYDTVSGKAMPLEVRYDGNQHFFVEHVPAITGGGSTAYGAPTGEGLINSTAPFCVKTDLHSGVLTFSYSLDGYNFRVIYSEANGSYLTPNAIGFGALSVTNNSANYVEIDILGWELSAI